MDLVRTLCSIIVITIISNVAHAQFVDEQGASESPLSQGQFLFDPSILEGEWEGQYHCDSNLNKGEGVYKLSVFSIGGRYKALFQWSITGANLSEELMEFRVLSPSLVRFGNSLIGHLESTERLFLHSTSAGINSTDFCNIRVLLRQ